MKLPKNRLFNLKKANLLCLSLAVSLLTLGCSSPKTPDRTSTGMPGFPNADSNFNDLIPPMFDDPTGDLGNYEGSALNVVVLYAVESRDRYYSQSSSDCFKSGDVAIRFPEQTIGGQKVIDWDLTCSSDVNPSEDSFVDCSELVLGGKRPSEIGIDKANGTVTYIYKNLPDEVYGFTSRTRDPLGRITSVEAPKTFVVCAEST